MSIGRLLELKRLIYSFRFLLAGALCFSVIYTVVHLFYFKQDLYPHHYLLPIVIGLLVGYVFRRWSQLKEQYEDNLKLLLEELKEKNIKLLEEVEAHRFTENKLESAKIEAESASEIKSRFISNISHEARTPLNSILGFSHILISRKESFGFNPEAMEYLEYINFSGKQLAEIIQNVFDYSEADHINAVVTNETVNVHELLHSIFNEFHPNIIKKSMQYRILIDPSTPLILSIDVNKISQAVGNLLSNAIKFTPDGKEVLLEVSKEGAYVRIRVSNQGVPIPRTKQSIIFEPFEQAESKSSTSSGGIGLGLPIAKKNIELMGGKLILTRSDKALTVFEIFLPETN